MFGNIGMPELIVIFTIALLIFGPRKLPELGRSLGRSLSEFKKASNELRSTLEEEIRVEEQRETAAKVAPVASAGTPVDQAVMNAGSSVGQPTASTGTPASQTVVSGGTPVGHTEDPASARAADHNG